MINNNTITSSDYISTYPALRHVHNGLKLIDIDFKNQYPDRVSRLIDGYKTLEHKIFTYCDKKNKKSLEIKTQLQQFKENINESEGYYCATHMILACYSNLYNLRITYFNTDTRSAILFRWLPLLLPSPPVITGKDKSTWRPTKESVVNGFLLHVKVSYVKLQFIVIDIMNIS